MAGDGARHIECTICTVLALGCDKTALPSKIFSTRQLVREWDVGMAIGFESIAETPSWFQKASEVISLVLKHGKSPLDLFLGVCGAVWVS